MKVLDSDFLIAVLRRHPDVGGKIEELLQSDETVATTVFNAQEVLSGALAGGSGKNVETANRLLNSISLLTYGQEEMHHAVELTHNLTKKGQRIGVFDELIAGICIAHDAVIITRNITHFGRVPGLNVESW